MSDTGHPKFRNDRGVPEICIGVREFECIGVSPPQDHPHIYIDMGGADTILCPYCGTCFHFDPRLRPLDAEPPDVSLLNRTRPKRSRGAGQVNHFTIFGTEIARSLIEILTARRSEATDPPRRHA